MVLSGKGRLHTMMNSPPPPPPNAPPPPPSTSQARDVTEDSIARDATQDSRVPQADPGGSCSGRAHNDPSLPAAAASWSQEDCCQHLFQLCILVCPL